jgi:hypothetical protein
LGERTARRRKQCGFSAGCCHSTGRSGIQRTAVCARISAACLAPAAGACAAADVGSCAAVPVILHHRAELCGQPASARERDRAERRSSRSGTEPRRSCCIENERTENGDDVVIFTCFKHVQPSAQPFSQIPSGASSREEQLFLTEKLRQMSSRRLRPL